jgi:hypothetical protein
LRTPTQKKLQPLDLGYCLPNYRAWEDETPT